MHYIVDGYNLLFLVLADVSPLRNAREKVIEVLSEKIASSRFTTTIVFDSSNEEALLFPSSHIRENVEIIYSPSGQSADEYIIEWIAWQKQPKIITLVSNDRKLCKEAKVLGAHSISINAFLKKFERPKKEASKTSQEETPYQIKRLKKIFEKRLRDEDTNA